MAAGPTTFSFHGTHIKGEENIAADKLSRIHCRVATIKDLELIQLALELELDSEG